ncbi:MAG TPA: hypothetical protein VKS79_05325 [Gemmataceae bacterium]|nr:hypothetical protein [Gemmataceae bacterium]
MVKTAPRYTAAQVILLAADDLMAQGASEFSEWELTLAAWKRDRERFGLRGYQESYPDHKRVMMEIMGKKPQNPILLGLMEKVRPNHYRLTSMGRSEAVRLRYSNEPETKRKATPLGQYDAISRFVKHQVFVKWRDDPDEPRRIADVADFLGADADNPEDLMKKFKDVVQLIENAIKWCNTNHTDYLIKDRNQATIHFRELAEISDFLQALKYRFPKQLEGKKGLPPKG